jgi:hypothetical protein
MAWIEWGPGPPGGGRAPPGDGDAHGLNATGSFNFTLQGGHDGSTFGDGGGPGPLDGHHINAVDAMVAAGVALAFILVAATAWYGAGLVFGRRRGSQALEATVQHTPEERRRFRRRSGAPRSGERQGLTAAEISAHLGGATVLSSAQAKDLTAKSCCSICLFDFAAGEEVRAMPCGHVYHSSCIDLWLAQRADCPLCKADVVVDIGGGEERAT